MSVSSIEPSALEQKMARLMDETFEMPVTVQYNIARHGGVEAIEVSIFCIIILLS